MECYGERVRRRVIVVGGGISGLSTAHALLTKHDADVRLFEASARLGGNLRTVQRDGYLIDEGPDSWVANKPHATTLCRALGLGDRLIETIEANRRVYMRTERGLVPLPDGLMLGIPTRILPLAMTPLLSLRGKARAALDLALPRGFGRRTVDGDEPLGAFIERRLGREVLDKLAGPLLGGLFTGDVEELSLLGTFPQLAALEEKGGLIRGALAMAPKTGKGRASAFLTLRGGVGELVDALVARLGDRARVSSPVTAISREGDQYVVEHAHGRERADHVVLAGPAHVAAELLGSIAEPAARELAAIPYSSAATVFVAHRRQDIAHPLDATGYLVPTKAPGVPLASTWVTSKWPHRAPADRALIRVFFGASDVDRSDQELIAAARDEMQRALRVTAEPVLVHVARFRRASPQPRVGHPARLRRVAEALPRGIHALGSAYEGVGISDCVRQAEVIADRIAEG